MEKFRQACGTDAPNIPTDWLSQIHERISPKYVVQGEHWILTTKTPYATINTIVLKVSIFCWMYKSKRCLKEGYCLYRTCDVAECVAPHHHEERALSTQISEWTDAEFARMLQRLKDNSVVGPGPHNMEQLGLCWNWTGALKHDGYPEHTRQIGISASGPQFAYFVKTKQTAFPAGTEASHQCGNKICVNPDHIEAETHPENLAQKILHGTSNHGAKNHSAKLSEEQARLIKFRDRSTMSRQACADLYKISLMIVTQIDRGYTWAWLGRTKAEDDKTIKGNRKEARIVDAQDWTEDEVAKVKRKIESKCNKKSDSEFPTEHWMYPKASDEAIYPTRGFLGKMYDLHKLVYLLWKTTSIPDGLVVRHKCPEKCCVNPDHLELGTQRQNMDDKNRDGTQSRGENHHSAKIDDNTALAIKRSRGEETQVMRAKRFKVSLSVVRNIDNNLSWKHISLIEANDQLIENNGQPTEANDQLMEPTGQGTESNDPSTEQNNQTTEATYQPTESEYVPSEHRGLLTFSNDPMTDC